MRKNMFKIPVVMFFSMLILDITAFAYQAGEVKLLGASDYHTLDGILRDMPNLHFPNVVMFLIIAFIYIILVGPVNYIVLNKKCKRELMWLTVPAVSIIFCTVMYFSGFITRIYSPVANIVSIINISQDDTFDVESYGGVFMPFDMDIKVEAVDGVDIKPVAPLKSGSSEISDISDRIYYHRDTKTGKMEVEFYKNNLWYVNMVAIESLQAVKRTVNAELSYDDTLLTGFFNNNTGMDFDDCFVILPGKYVSVGEIKNGESKNVSGKLKNYGAEYELVKSLYPDVYGGEGYKNNGKNEIALQREDYQNYQLMNYYFTSRDIKIHDPVIFAISKTKVSKEIIVNKGKTQNYEKSLIIMNGQIIKKVAGGAR